MKEIRIAHDARPADHMALRCALVEMRSARAKHGESLERDDASDGLRLSILVEEVGEVAKALNDLSGVSAPGMPTLLDCARDNLREELAQVAATALRWLGRELR